MGPNELQAAFEKAGDKKAAMDVLTSRTMAILDLYQLGLKNFLADPVKYDPKFNIKAISHQPKHHQENYFKRVSATMLIAATQGMITGEAFHTLHYIKAAKKANPKKPAVKIEGVTMPDLGESGPDMEAPCTCGHNYGTHTSETEGFCIDMDCPCVKFEALPQLKGSPDHAN